MKNRTLTGLLAVRENLLPFGWSQKRKVMKKRLNSLPGPKNLSQGKTPGFWLGNFSFVEREL
jgi:hypothetical protein